MNERIYNMGDWEVIAKRFIKQRPGRFLLLATARQNNVLHLSLEEQFIGWTTDNSGEDGWPNEAVVNNHLNRWLELAIEDFYFNA